MAEPRQELGRELRRIVADTLSCVAAMEAASVAIRPRRITATAVGPARHDPQRMWIRYRATVRETFASAPPPDRDPARPWRGYAMYPADLIDRLWDERHQAAVARDLAMLGIEVEMDRG